MRINGKKLLSIGLVVVPIAAVIWIAFSNRELENAWEALAGLNPVWVLGFSDAGLRICSLTDSDPGYICGRRDSGSPWDEASTPA